VGGICNGGALTIINSTFSGNFARQHRGGAIGNYGTLTITNSTYLLLATAEIPDELER
jgi:hypothetical protein